MIKTKKLLKFIKIYSCTKYFYKLLKKIKNCLFPKTIILLYHRIMNLENDPQLLAVNPQNFEAQMKYLKKKYHILSLDCLVNSLKKGSIPKKSVVITFDDGYVDNYVFAKPILEKLKIPATIFISTGNINKNKEFWWDNLERVFLLKQRIPKILKLKIYGYEYVWKLDTEEQKKETYNEIYKMLLKLNPKGIERVIKSLLRWAKLKEDARKNYRTMNKKEIGKIGKKEIIDIGSHAVSHCNLSMQNKNSQEKEIIQSNKEIEKITNEKVRHFSYPFGGKNDYNKQTLAIVSKQFESACANFPGQITKKAGIYELPRFIIRDWDRKEFIKKIKLFHSC